MEVNLSVSSVGRHPQAHGSFPGCQYNPSSTDVKNAWVLYMTGLMGLKGRKMECLLLLSLNHPGYGH